MITLPFQSSHEDVRHATLVYCSFWFHVFPWMVRKWTSVITGSAFFPTLSPLRSWKSPWDFCKAWVLENPVACSVCGRCWYAFHTIWYKPWRCRPLTISDSGQSQAAIDWVLGPANALNHTEVHFRGPHTTPGYLVEVKQRTVILKEPKHIPILVLELHSLRNDVYCKGTQKLIWE
jgi:hypothetical protein